ncbi:DUF4179 domain-containing protein [Sutcliffiella cohnii]
MDQMERNIKRMVDSVDVPSAKLEETVNRSLQIAKKQNNRAFNRRQNIFASIASIFILAIGALLFTSYLQDGKDSTASLTKNSIMFQLGDDSLKRMVVEGRVTDLSLEVEDKGIKVILEEAYLDNLQLAVTYRIEGIEANNYISSNTKLRINGNDPEWYKDMNHSDEKTIATFTLSKELPSISDIEFKITSIENIEGDWSFRFPIENQKEYITSNSVVRKTDDVGNFFSLNKQLLTPSTLTIHASSILNIEEDLPRDFSHQEFAVVAIGNDGETYLEPTHHQYGTNSLMDITAPSVISNNIIEINRRKDLYSYKLTPYFVTYKGEKEGGQNRGYSLYLDEIKAPFLKEATLSLQQAKYKVLDIKHYPDKTIVYYDINNLLPHFPKIFDQARETYYDAKSYKVEQDYVRVIYPKINNYHKDSLQLMMYDATYKVYSDLAIEIDMK